MLGHQRMFRAPTIFPSGRNTLPNTHRRPVKSGCLEHSPDGSTPLSLEHLSPILPLNDSEQKLFSLS